MTFNFFQAIDPYEKSFKNDTKGVVVPMDCTALYFNQSRFAFGS